MRLWSLHPRYLDAAGLVACWREGLLARAVLGGNTVGYRNHPQLVRFKACADPVAAIDTYLAGILAEGERRGYRFDATKLGPGDCGLMIAVGEGQLACESEWLRAKLNRRCPERCAELEDVSRVDTHPMFERVAGGIEKWEIVK